MYSVSDILSGLQHRAVRAYNCTVYADRFDLQYTVRNADWRQRVRYANSACLHRNRWIVSQTTAQTEQAKIINLYILMWFYYL